MEAAFINTINVLAYVLLDRPFTKNEPFCLKTSYKIAKQHEMSTVYCAGVVKLYNNGLLKISKEEFELYNTLLLKKAIKNTCNFENMNLFLKNKFKNYIPFVAIKGRSLAELYPFAEYRESCDTDILISEADETKAISLLSESGFKIKRRAATGNHSECVHKTYGVLELHTSLFYQTVQKNWFGGFNPDLNDCITKNGELTLNTNDAFLFLVLHSFKHFVSNVFNLKQFFDILLFLKTFNNEIDKPYIKKFLCEIKVENFLNTVLSAAAKYINANISDWFDFKETEFVTELLEDMQKGGCFNFNLKKHGDMFELVHYEKLSALNKSEAIKSFTNWRREGLIKTVSFSKENMKKRYGQLANTPHFLVKARCKHVKCLFNTACKRPKLIRDCIKFKPKKANKIQQARLQMIKRMGLI